MNTSNAEKAWTTAAEGLEGGGQKKKEERGKYTRPEGKKRALDGRNTQLRALKAKLDERREHFRRTKKNS